MNVTPAMPADPKAAFDYAMAHKSPLVNQMAMELPQVDPARIAYCEQQADKFWSMAEQEERDKSPIYYAPNISYYTR